MRHLPNALCVLRMLLAIPVAWLLVREAYGATLLVFGVAAITDGLDGYLAKRFNWTSELGKALDPLADKILLVTTFVVLTYPVGAVPLWLAIPVVLRDLIITAGALSYVRWIGPLTDAKPTPISKWNTVMQIGYVLAVVGVRAIDIEALLLITVLATLVIVTTVASGIDYIATYLQRAMHISRTRGPV